MLLNGIAETPVVGLAALTVILVTLVAHRQLPFKFPGALAAVLIGVLIYQLCHGLGAAFHWPLVTPPGEAAAVEPWQPGAMVSFYGAGEWTASSCTPWRNYP